MSKKIIRAISVMLLLATVFMMTMSVGAFGPTNRTTTSTISVVTCGDSIFGKNSYFTVKNTGKSPIVCSGPTQLNGCTWSKDVGWGFNKSNQCTIYPGGQAKFKLRTGFGKVGTMRFKIWSAWGGRYSANISGTKYSCMAIVG